MITDAFFGAIFGSLNALLGLIPAIGLPPADDQTGVIVWAGALSLVFPLAHLAIAMGSVIATRIGLQVWDLTVFIYHQFWGSD